MNTKSKWSALWISFIIIVVMYVPFVGYSVKTLEIMDELSLSYTVVSLLASVTFLAAGLSYPYLGALTDRYGPKKIIVFGLLIIALGQFIFSISPSISLLLISRAIIGIGVAALIIAPYTLAILWFQDSKAHGISMGVMLGADGVGTLVASYLFSIFLITFGWRSGSLIGCLPLLIILFIALKYLKDPPNFSKIIEVGTLKKNDGFKSNIPLLINRNVIGSSIYLIALTSAFSLAVYWVPTILIEENGWSEELAGFIGASFAVAGTLSSIAFGFFSDKLGKRTLLINVAGVGLLLMFFGFSYSYVIGNYNLLAILLPLAGLFAYAGMPVAYALVADTVDQSKIGVANGIVVCLGFTIGGLVVPLLIGYVKDTTDSYSIGFVVLTIYLFVSTIINVFLLKDRVKKSSVDAPSSTPANF